MGRKKDAFVEPSQRGGLLSGSKGGRNADFPRVPITLRRL
jgi:hypothetical protein